MIATVPVGAGPSAVAYSPDGDRVYAIDHDDGTLAMLDAATLGVLAVIPVGAAPVDVTSVPIVAGSWWSTPATAPWR